MRIWALFFTVLTAFMAGCGHQRTTGQHSAVQDTTGISDDDRLSCLLLGYDSIIYYHGSSSRMQDIKRGVITDTAFINDMFRTVKSQGFLFTIKPGGGADVGTNLQEITDQANSRAIAPRSVAIIDSNEEKAFGVSTPPQIVDMMNGKRPEFKLNLPKDDEQSDTTLSSYPKASQLNILVAGDDGIYAYWGDNLREGKKYTYEELTKLLKAKPSDGHFIAVIRPSAAATYKNTVDMLDVMKTTDVKHYALMDIRKEEEDYLRQIYR
jgi:biopolymer transport protein ExbD